jgi:hypothetical protein
VFEGVVIRVFWRLRDEIINQGINDESKNHDYFIKIKETFAIGNKQHCLIANNCASAISPMKVGYSALKVSIWPVHFQAKRSVSWTTTIEYDDDKRKSG